MNTIENCVCGQCFYCPDGFHQEQPCICTPACASEDPELHAYDGNGDEVCPLCGYPPQDHPD